jgi:hypothetical protein
MGSMEPMGSDSLLSHKMRMKKGLNPVELLQWLCDQTL